MCCTHILVCLAWHAARCTAAPLHRIALHTRLKTPRWCPQIAFGGVNSRVYHDIAEKHGITSYPWVTSFYKGKKMEDMAGLGGWESVYNWAKAKHKVSANTTRHTLVSTSAICHAAYLTQILSTASHLT